MCCASLRNSGLTEASTKAGPGAGKEFAAALRRAAAVAILDADVAAVAVAVAASVCGASAAAAGAMALIKAAVSY